MDNTPQTITELLLKHLEIAVLHEHRPVPDESAGEETDASAQLFLDYPISEPMLNRMAAQRAYTEMTDSDFHSLGSA